MIPKEKMMMMMISKKIPKKIPKKKNIPKKIPKKKKKKMMTIPKSKKDLWKDTVPSPFPRDMEAVPKVSSKHPLGHQTGFLPLHGSSCPAQPGAQSWSKSSFKNNPGMQHHKEWEGSWLLSSQGEEI